MHLVAQNEGRKRGETGVKTGRLATALRPLYGYKYGQFLD